MEREARARLLFPVDTSARFRVCIPLLSLAFFSLFSRALAPISVNQRPAEAVGDHWEKSIRKEQQWKQQRRRRRRRSWFTRSRGTDDEKTSTPLLYSLTHSLTPAAPLPPSTAAAAWLLQHQRHRALIVPAKQDSQNGQTSKENTGLSCQERHH